MVVLGKRRLDTKFDLVRLDGSDDKHETKPSARRYHPSVLYDGQMVVFGGEDGGYKTTSGH